MARPIKQMDRPELVAASAKVRRRATLLANVVATTIAGASAINSAIDAFNVASDRPGCMENTFVLSHTNALIPFFAISLNISRSKGSPTPGSVSILKSPECKTRPSGVSMTKALLSGMECEIGANPTLNGPTSTVSGHFITVFTLRGL